MIGGPGCRGWFVYPENVFSDEIVVRTLGKTRRALCRLCRPLSPINDFSVVDHNCNLTFNYLGYFGVLYKNVRITRRPPVAGRFLQVSKRRKSGPLKSYSPESRCQKVQQ
jgi:hypothetical protein